jgi:hypothetical protein
LLSFSLLVLFFLFDCLFQERRNKPFLFVCFFLFAFTFN